MINTFDKTLYKLANQTLSAEWLDPVMYYFSHKYFWIPLYCIVMVFIIQTFRKKAIVAILALAIVVVAADRISSGVMKPYFKRTRPCHEMELTPRQVSNVFCSDTGSMPSSHAANHFGVAMFMVLLFGYSRKSALFWFVWAAAIAYSRVYLGVHYPTDVMAGAVLGIAIGWLLYKIYHITVTKIKWLS